MARGDHHLYKEADCWRHRLIEEQTWRGGDHHSYKEAEYWHHRLVEKWIQGGVTTTCSM